MCKKILIIDDNKEELENTGEILSLAGYKTYQARNGKKGLELARRHIPDLILCEIEMPELDGYGVIQALENIPEMHGIPFIFMTAKSGKADFRKGMDFGADDYFIKPFEGNALLKIVAARLKKSQFIKQTFKNSAATEIEMTDHSVLKPGVNALTDGRTIKRIRKNDLLFMEGDCSEFLYFIVSGRIKIVKSNESGKEYMIDIRKQGDSLGYLVLLEDNKHKETAIAIEDSEVALVPKDDFLNLLYSNVNVTKKFVKLMSANLLESEDKLLKLAYDSARKRVAEAIIFVSKKYHSIVKDDIGFNTNRENISALSGISTESVSRNMTNFRDEGLIETMRGGIKIINYKKLEMVRN